MQSNHHAWLVFTVPRPCSHYDIALQYSLASKEKNRAETWTQPNYGSWCLNVSKAGAAGGRPSALSEVSLKRQRPRSRALLRNDVLGGRPAPMGAYLPQGLMASFSWL